VLRARHRTWTQLLGERHLTDHRPNGEAQGELARADKTTVLAVFVPTMLAGLALVVTGAWQTAPASNLPRVLLAGIAVEGLALSVAAFSLLPPLFGG
jgi:hypothetical protein